MKTVSVLVLALILVALPQMESQALGKDKDGWFSWKKVHYAQLGKKVYKAIKADKSLQKGYHIICKRYIVPKPGYTLLRTVHPEMFILFNEEADGLGPNINKYKKWKSKFEDRSMYISRCTCENEGSENKGDCRFSRDEEQNLDLSECRQNRDGCKCVAKTVYIGPKGEVQYGY